MSKRNAREGWFFFKNPSSRLRLTDFSADFHCCFFLLRQPTYSSSFPTKIKHSIRTHFFGSVSRTNQWTWTIDLIEVCCLWSSSPSGNMAVGWVACSRQLSLSNWRLRHQGFRCSFLRQHHFCSCSGWRALRKYYYILWWNLVSRFFFLSLMMNRSAKRVTKYHGYVMLPDSMFMVLRWFESWITCLPWQENI